MDLNYKLKENDYLQMALYFAKEDGKLKKEIIKSTIIRVGMLLLFSAFAYKGIYNPLSYLFPIGSVLCLIFFSFYCKKL